MQNCKPAIFQFGEPCLMVFIMLLVMSTLAYPLWDLRRAQAEWVSCLRSRAGLPSLLIIAFVLVTQGLLIARNFSAFWGVEIMESGDVRLEYWWPRPDVVLSLSSVQKLKEVDRVYRVLRPGNGKIRRKSVHLTTLSGHDHRSVDIREPKQMAAVMKALQDCTGLRPQRFVRCGFFGTLVPVQ